MVSNVRKLIILVLAGIACGTYPKKPAQTEDVTLSGKQGSKNTEIASSKKDSNACRSVEQKPSKKPKKMTKRAERRERKKAKRAEIAQLPLDQQPKSWLSKVFGERKTLTTMNFEELKEAKDRYLANNDKVGALKFMEKMVSKTNDLETLRTLMLDVADLLYETRNQQVGNLDKAATMYKEYLTLYPGSAKAEYASYKAVICVFDRIGDYDRDQTKTVETLELAERFLEQTDLYKTYTQEVQTIATACKQRLFESEMNVLNFYIGRSRFTSANKRIETIRKDFAEKLDGAEQKILVYECELAQLQKNTQLFEKKQLELAQKFPDFNKPVLLAQNTKSTSFANKF